jgi:hypothetical protein
VVPQHHNLEIHHGRLDDPPVSSAGIGPGTAWHEQAAPAGPDPAWRDGYGYAASDDYDLAAAEPAWVAALIGGSSQGWRDGQDWAAEPVLPADHPSAPVPRIRLPEDQPAWTTWAPRPPAWPGSEDAGSRSSFVGQDLPRRRPIARKADGPGYRPPAARPPRDPLHVHRPGRHASAAPPDQAHWEVQRKPGSGVGEVVGFQRQAGTGRPETVDYWRDAGPHGPGPRPMTGFRNSPPPSNDSVYRAKQVLTLADGQAARIAEEAQASAVAIREAAEREAAAIREGAEREAAELRARLDSLLGDLSRVVAAYIAESLATPAGQATAPALPAARPARPVTLPATEPEEPDTNSARPQARPAGRVMPDTTRRPRPDTGPGTKPGAGRAMPETTERSRPRPSTAPGAKPKPTGPKTTAGQPDGRTRQQLAMRIATTGTAALLSIAAIGAVTYTSIHGFSFFVFRESGQGVTPGNFTDAKFLARQAAEQHHTTAPKGRHHKVTTSP